MSRHPSDRSRCSTCGRDRCPGASAPRSSTDLSAAAPRISPAAMPLTTPARSRRCCPGKSAVRTATACCSVPRSRSSCTAQPRIPSRASPAPPPPLTRAPRGECSRLCAEADLEPQLSRRHGRGQPRAGAGGVLAIVRMLSRGELDALLDCARALGLFVLLEAFDARDLELVRDLVASHAGPHPLLAGVNCRDLGTLEVMPRRLLELSPLLPPGTPCVAESGVISPADVREIAAAGYRLALIGSALMRGRDPRTLARTLLAAGRASPEAAWRGSRSSAIRATRRWRARSEAA